MISGGDNRSTIVAIASSTAPAVRGIVRIAGDDAVRVLASMSPGFDPDSITAPMVTEVEIELGQPLGKLDVMALVWPGTQSYTGSPSVEIHTYGSAPLLEGIASVAVSAGARPAGPGEFTMRAFLAGRLDLTQAEAVLGVIDAADRDQLDAALTQLAGNVSQPLRNVRDDLLDLLADLEAGLDFVDEDIRFIEDDEVRKRLAAAGEVIAGAAAQMSARHRSTAAIDVILRGEPNAGKSSLLNALAGRPVALVSDVAGTTRDVVWLETTIGNHPVRFLDTAGFEQTTSVDAESGGDGAEEEIRRQSQSAAEQGQRTAAVTLMCVDRGIGAADDDDDADAVAADRSMDGRVTLAVATQCDRIGDESRLDSLRRGGWIVTSAATGLGLDDLRREIATVLDAQVGGSELGVAATAARCGDSIRRAAGGIDAAIGLLDDCAGHEWVAGEIRLALSAIADVTGEIYTDDILDRVFSRFCIGK
jgi:tRNA modification GTPase